MTDPDLRLRLSLCALDLVLRETERTGVPAVMSLTDGGRMGLHLPSGTVYEITGDEMDVFQSRGWVEVVDAAGPDAPGELSLTESGRYWAGRWRRDRAFRAIMGVA